MTEPLTIDGLARAAFAATWPHGAARWEGVMAGVRVDYRANARAVVLALADDDAVILAEFERMFLALGWSSVPEAPHWQAVERRRAIIAEARALLADGESRG